MSNNLALLGVHKVMNADLISGIIFMWQIVAAELVPDIIIMAFTTDISQTHPKDPQMTSYVALNTYL